MAIANGTCVSFCNQRKAQFGYTSGESRRYVVAFTRFVDGYIWLPKESLRHILASPGYAPGTIAVNGTWMKKDSMHRSMYLSIFNLFSVIQPVSSKVRYFSTFLHILASSLRHFHTPPLFSAPAGVTPSEFREDLVYTQN